MVMAGILLCLRSVEACGLTLYMLAAAERAHHVSDAHPNFSIPPVVGTFP